MPMRMAVYLALILVASGAPRTETAQPGEPRDGGVDWLASPNQTFLEGLRERRLFRLAEAYCQRQLNDPELLVAERFELAIELVRSYVLHAMESSPGERQPLWDRAHQVWTDLESSHPKHPRLVLLQLQDALAWRAQGELEWHSSQWGPRQESQDERIRASLRSAIKQLGGVDLSVRDQLRRQYRARPSDEGEWTIAELETLKKNVAFQLARALRCQARSYDVGTADYTNSLTQALGRVAPVARLAVADSLVWQSRIEELICLRLLGQFDNAAARLDTLHAADPPPRIDLLARAEQIHLLLAQGRPQQALALLDRPAGSAQVHSPEFDMAGLHSVIAAWREAVQSKDQARAAQYARQASDLVRRIEELHGPYWMRRAEELFASALADGELVSDLGVLVRAAESFYRSGGMDRSVATYDQAHQQAVRQGQLEAAFEAALAAAAIQQGRDRDEDALERFRKLALQYPQHPRASRAHLMAAYCAAVLVRRAGPGDLSGGLDRYHALLEEHLRRWPEEETAGQVRVWLGRFYESKRLWPQAAAAFRGVRLDNSHFDSALRGATRAFDQQLGALAEQGQSTADVARDAVAYLNQVVHGANGRTPETWDSSTRRAALDLARLQIRYIDGGSAAAERVLSAAISGPPDASEGFRSEAEALLVLAMVRQGKRVDAEQFINRIVASCGELHVGLLDSLISFALTAPSSERTHIAALAVRLADGLEKNAEKLSAESVRRVKFARAAALAESGDDAQALAAYEQLAQHDPQDLRATEGLARILLRSQDPKQLADSIARWREVEGKSRQGSGRWLAARCGQAEAYEKLGQTEKAARLVQLTKVLHPDLGGAEMKSRFMAILARCEAAPPPRP